MEPCNLNTDSISLLVKEHLLPNSEGEGWRSEWNTDCALREGVTIRIPYDPDEINATNVQPVEDVDSEDPTEETEDTPTVAEGDAPVEEPVPTSAGENPQRPPTQNNDSEETVMPPEGSENSATETPTATAKPAKSQEQELTATTSADPTGGLAGEFNALAQTTGSDPTLTIVLAVIAVLGGGTAWKFYRQHSEQKHEQEMQKMKLEAKAKGMEGQSPGPCQTVHAQLKAEVEEMKSRLDKVDKKMALNADFDSDDLERKVRKLEKWRRSVEDEEDDA